MRERRPGVRISCTWTDTRGGQQWVPTPPAAPRAAHAALPQLRWRLSDEPVAGGEEPERADPAFRAATRCKIFLGYTSNLVSAGVREHIRYLVQVSPTSGARAGQTARALLRGAAEQAPSRHWPGRQRLRAQQTLPVSRHPAPPLPVSPCQHRMVDVIVTTAGGVEEDYIKVRWVLWRAVLIGGVVGLG